MLQHKVLIFLVTIAIITAKITVSDNICKIFLSTPDKNEKPMYSNGSPHSTCQSYHSPSRSPTESPTIKPTGSPPSKSPTKFPTTNPTNMPTKPTTFPSKCPTKKPTKCPTKKPTKCPSLRYVPFSPTKSPTTKFGTKHSGIINVQAIPISLSDNREVDLIDTTTNPTNFPTKNPTPEPTKFPTKYPTANPSSNPTNNPTKFPSQSPTKFPSKNPTQNPTKFPTKFPSMCPTNYPTSSPTKTPTEIRVAFTTVGEGRCQDEDKNLMDENFIGFTNYGGDLNACQDACERTTGCLGLQFTFESEIAIEEEPVAIEQDTRNLEEEFNDDTEWRTNDNVSNPKPQPIVAFLELFIFLVVILAVWCSCVSQQTTNNNLDTNIENNDIEDHLDQYFITQHAKI